MSSRKIVITGGAGFIGSQIAYALHCAGESVVLLDNMSTGKLDNLLINGVFWGDLIVRDIRDADLRSIFEKADVIYHLAGIAALPVCQSNPQHAYDINTAGTANVLEAARLEGVSRVIVSSTSAVYECSAGDVHAEDDPISPNLVYAMTKQAAESTCKAYSANYGLDIIIARFFNVYGPHQDFKRKSPPFTSYIARELASGRSPVLFNESDAKRDYVHSTDVIQLLRQMGEAPGNFHADVFNVGAGKGYSVPELYAIMQRIAGNSTPAVYKDPEAYWNGYPGLFAPPYPLSEDRVRREVFKNAIADIRKTSQAFGWQPRVAIEEGLRSVYAYALEHRVPGE